MQSFLANLTLIIWDTEEEEDPEWRSFTAHGFRSMFNWVPPTPALAFILISVVQKSRRTRFENSAMLRRALPKRKRNQNKIPLENLLMGTWEWVGKVREVEKQSRTV